MDHASNYQRLTMSKVNNGRQLMLEMATMTRRKGSASDRYRRCRDDGVTLPPSTRKLCRYRHPR